MLELKGLSFSVLNASATISAESTDCPTLEWKLRKPWNFKLVQVASHSFVSHLRVGITVLKDADDSEDENSTQNVEDNPSKDLGLEQYGSD